MPYQTKEFPYSLRIGVDIRMCNNLPSLFNAIDHNIDFLMVDTCHAMNFRDHSTNETRDIALSRPGKYA